MMCSNSRQPMEYCFYEWLRSRRERLVCHSTAHALRMLREIKGGSHSVAFSAARR